MYSNRIARLRKEAEGKFRNFEGITYDRPYYNAAAPGGGRQPSASAEILDPNDRTLTISVANASTAAVSSVILFGATKDLTDANVDSDITISVAESSHVQVKNEILGGPFRILGMKMTVTSATQFSNVLTLYDAKSTGGQRSAVFQALNYRSAQNQLTTQIDAPSFELLVTPTTYISFTINGSETVTFTFTIVEKAQFQNVLRNAPVVAASNKPSPTGLPQMDMPRGI